MKLKDIFSGIGAFVIFAFPAAFMIYSLESAVAYKSIMESEAKYSWYNNNWYTDAYIKFQVYQYPSKFIATTNGDGSEGWICKETKIGHVTFWTIDYKWKLK